ncbi:MAG: GH116 family glycosyl hydrolase [Anaerolineae bacterium]
MADKARAYNGVYSGEYLNHVAFPLGGIGAGMICLEGTGALSHVSLRGHPDIFNEPLIFSALCVKGEPNVARVLEGPVPGWKLFFPWGETFAGAGGGGRNKAYGLPHCAHAEFQARFPFGTVRLTDPKVPLEIEITGWSPFTPGDADRSSLPVAALEVRLANPTAAPVDAVYSFHAHNFMALRAESGAVRSTENGFVLWQPGGEESPWEQGAFSAAVDDPETRVNCAWFRGGWFDPLTVLWKSVAEGTTPEAKPIAEGLPSAGGSLYVPFHLPPGGEKVIRLRLAWHVPETNLRQGQDPAPLASGANGACCAEGACCCDGEGTAQTHKPWYASVFEDIEAVTAYWREHYETLRQASARFSDCFYDTTLPPEVIEAAAANLTILKSPTVLRQADGRLWCWEGCHDAAGCCEGSCTHVWNYAQALPHLFPDLERSLRQTEFHESQDARGHQSFRAGLPVRPVAHRFHAAADGQLGGIIKVHREWRISGDGDWLRGIWPQVQRSLDYCIATWDPEHTGALVEPHHNTYDIEFWGPDGMCTSFYLGALQAAAAMAEEVGDDPAPYRALLEKGRATVESELWNGEYLIQRVQWQGLRAADPTQQQDWNVSYSPEAVELLAREGPKYQYGTGCLSDGVLGAWIAACCGVDPFLDGQKVESHLLAVHRYNLRHDLSEHANPQRPTYAVGKEGGLLLCTWPRGGMPTLPFVYSNEVWTGIEYQVASHLMMTGHAEEGLEIVRVARDRYDGRVRNPFDEYECGHWYARAMASYALLQGMTGAWYDAVDHTLTLKPSRSGDLRAFLCTATGYGTVGLRDGAPFVEVRQGTIPYEQIVYDPPA